MRRLLAARGATTAAVSVLVVLAAGGGYALAGGGSGKITVCVSHKGGALYKAHKCAKHDKKLSWNVVGPQGPPGNQGNVGPQGPGATSLRYNASGSTSPTVTTLGKMGPWTVSAECTADGAGGTGFQFDMTGPGFEGDSAQVDASTAVVPGPLTDFALVTDPPASGQQTAGGVVTFYPSDGSGPVETAITLISDGNSPSPGATANTCHMSITTIPVAAPPAGDAPASPAFKAARSTRSLLGG